MPFQPGFKGAPKLREVVFAEGLGGIMGGVSSFDLPTGIQDGDVAIVWIYAANISSTPPDATPDGWTSIATASLGIFRHKVMYRHLSAADAETTVSGIVSGVINQRTYIFLRGNRPIQTISVSTPGNQITDGNPSPQTIAVTGQVAPLWAFAYYATRLFEGQTVDPASFSPEQDGQAYEDDQFLQVKFKRYDLGATPTNITVDMDDEGFANCLISFYMRFR